MISTDSTFAVAPRYEQPEQSISPAAFLTAGMGLRGTPAYMSPEQWQEKDCTPASDIWAWGIMLYELLSGHHPYPLSNMTHLRSLILHQHPVSWESLPEELPTELIELLQRCLAHEAQQRPSARQLVMEQFDYGISPPIIIA